MITLLLQLLRRLPFLCGGHRQLALEIRKTRSQRDKLSLLGCARTRITARKDVVSQLPSASVLHFQNFRSIHCFNNLLCGDNHGDAHIDLFVGKGRGISVINVEVSMNETEKAEDAATVRRDLERVIVDTDRGQVSKDGRSTQAADRKCLDEICFNRTDGVRLDALLRHCSDVADANNRDVLPLPNVIYEKTHDEYLIANADALLAYDLRRHGRLQAK